MTEFACPQGAEIAVASPILPGRLALLGGIEAHRDFLEQAGFTGGIELHPMRRSRLGHELTLAASDDEMSASDIVRSAHQSFLSISEGMVPHHNLSELRMMARALAALPTAKRSLGMISSYLRAAGNPYAPVVVYPEIGHEPREHGIVRPIFQPNVRVLRRWGVSTTDEVIAHAIQNGMAGIAWDGYHYLRTAKDGTRMEQWEDVLPKFLATETMPIAEVHLSIGRSDRTENQALMEATRKEMAIFLEQPRSIGSTVTGKMIRMIHDAHKGRMRYVLEAVLPKNQSKEESLKTLATNLAVFLDSGSKA